MSYFSYHGHTEHSNIRLIDSINKPHQVLDKAHELGLTGIAITDHESLGSFITAEKYLQSKKGVDEVWDNLRFVRGNEIYLTRNSLNAENYDKEEDRYFHFILLAKNYRGYQQLCEISSRAWERSYQHYQMRVPTYYSDLVDIIGGEQGNIIGSTACLGSQIGTKLLNVLDGKISLEEALDYNRAWLSRMSEIFGKDNLLVELQPGVTKEQIFVNKYLYDLAIELGLTPTITTDYHYIEQEDRDIHRAFLKSNNGEREVDSFYEATFIMSPEEIHKRMDEHFSYEIVEELLSNTNKVLDQIEDYSLLKPLELPYLPQEQFDVPDLTVDDAPEVVKEIPFLKTYLNSSERANVQLASRIINFMKEDSEIEGKKNFEVPEKAKYMDEELRLIWDSGVKQGVNWSKYFLQDADYIKLFWTISVVGPSRGSAGASYVCYALGITQIDPTREKAPVLLKRFMNPDRVSVLDIDTDIAADKRNECIQLLENTYGEDRVIRVSTFKTETAKSAILTAGRALDLDVDDTRYMAGTIPEDRGILRTLTQAYWGDEENNIKPSREFVRLMNENPRLWEIAQKIEGLITGLSSHAGGVVITEKPIIEYCGVMKTRSGDRVTAYDLHELEEMSQ